MTRQQRFKYEMFVRVRDFGVVHAALFPEASTGGQAFARVAAAVATIDEKQKDHMVGQAEARRIKAATRDAVYDYMKTIAAAARRVTKREPAEIPFVLPRKRRLGAELSAARLFMESAAARQKDFERFGLPPTFLADFKARVDHLQQAADVRLSSRTVRSKAQAGTAAALAEGLDACRDLDVIVAVTTRESDPTTFAAWTTARRIDVAGSPLPQPVTTPVAPPARLPAPIASGAQSTPHAASVPTESPVPVGELVKAS